jgi:phospholipid/cholesterol/gamma-HCH transport system permease protein
MAGKPDSVPARGDSFPVRVIIALGNATARAIDRVVIFVTFVGGAIALLLDAIVWFGRTLVPRRGRFGPPGLVAQMVRVGVDSIPIVCLVQVFIGIILALQMAPTLEAYGQLQRVADIIGIAIFRVLGPLISAIVLSGFAGASIAAEIGAMVESEEVKALEAHAINPIRFLVVPRVVATVVMLVGLSVLADVVGVFGGLLTGWTVLDIEPRVYIDATQAALKTKDFLTGLVKAVVFGVLISVIACYEGLTVSGGAVGVGRATTATVVKSIVSLIAVDTVFTTLFYLFGL